MKVAINGFGRIGRLALRIGMKKYKGKMEFAAINTSGRMEVEGWAHLFEYDTVYGQYKGKVSSSSAGELVVDGKKIKMLAVEKPIDLPWKKLKVDLVLECTGKFRKPEEVDDHLQAGAKQVLLSAPPKDADKGIYIRGINDKNIGKEKVFSNASCTTNCVAPIMQVMMSKFGVEKAAMTTIHAVTSSQRMVDNSHKDLRRARAACFNIIPTTTGAAGTTTKVMPDLEGIFDGIAVRVPILTGSLTDFTFLTKKKTSVEEVNKALKQAAKGKFKGILEATDEPIVSSDIVGSSFSSIADLGMTRVVDGDMVKILSWYDNEWGYVARMMELALKAGKK